MGRREDKARMTRSKILTVADRMIGEHGYEDVSVDELVAACGIAKGTFYNYFESKEALIQALSQAHFADVTGKVEDYATRPPVQAVEEYLLAYMGVIVDARIGLARQWVRYIATASGSHGKWDQDRRDLSRLLDLMVKAGTLGSGLSVEGMSSFIMTQMYGIVLTWTIAESMVNPLEAVRGFSRNQLPEVMRPYLTGSGGFSTVARTSSEKTKVKQ
ncbi:TetR/AcrR family transcriptional regulator [Bifidobacterium aemilianum]|nr:TetR/AcrR family transcriptional regulator [Bifidobacterium aemilianum]